MRSLRALALLLMLALIGQTFDRCLADCHARARTEAGHCHEATSTDGSPTHLREALDCGHDHRQAWLTAAEAATAPVEITWLLAASDVARLPGVAPNARLLPRVDSPASSSPRPEIEFPIRC